VRDPGVEEVLGRGGRAQVLPRRQPVVRVGRGLVRQRQRPVHERLQAGRLEVVGVREPQPLVLQHAQAHALGGGLGEVLDLPVAHADAGLAADLHQRLRLLRASPARPLHQLLGQLLRRRPAHRATLVPPTVMPSMRSVGNPTPTGTIWPSFPHIPIPGSGMGSQPTIVTFFSASGPTPISMAFFTGRPSFPSSIWYASLTSKTKLPLVMSTCPPPNCAQYRPFFTDPRMSSGASSPGAR